MYDENDAIGSEGTDPWSAYSRVMKQGRSALGLPTAFFGGGDSSDQSFDDGGVVDTSDDGGNGGQPQQGLSDPRMTMAYLAGHGSVSPDLVAALEKHVDPQGAMSPAARKFAAFQAAPPQAKFGVAQSYRQKYNGFSGAARASLDQGNMASAAHYATQAMAHIPTGNDVQFAPASGGGLAMHSKPISQPGMADGGMVGGAIGMAGAGGVPALFDGGVVAADETNPTKTFGENSNMTTPNYAAGGVVAAPLSSSNIAPEIAEVNQATNTANQTIDSAVNAAMQNIPEQYRPPEAGVGGFTRPGMGSSGQPSKGGVRSGIPAAPRTSFSMPSWGSSWQSTPWYNPGSNVTGTPLDFPTGINAGLSPGQQGFYGSQKWTGNGFTKPTPPAAIGGELYNPSLQTSYGQPSWMGSPGEASSGQLAYDDGGDVEEMPYSGDTDVEDSQANAQVLSAEAAKNAVGPDAPDRIVDHGWTGWLKSVFGGAKSTSAEAAPAQAPAEPAPAQAPAAPPTNPATSLIKGIGDTFSPEEQANSPVNRVKNWFRGGPKPAEAAPAEAAPAAQAPQTPGVPAAPTPENKSQDFIPAAKGDRMATAKPKPKPQPPSMDDKMKNWERAAYQIFPWASQGAQREQFMQQRYAADERANREQGNERLKGDVQRDIWGVRGQGNEAVQRLRNEGGIGREGVKQDATNARQDKQLESKEGMQQALLSAKSDQEVRTMVSRYLALHPNKSVEDNLKDIQPALDRFKQQHPVKPGEDLLTNQKEPKIGTIKDGYRYVGGPGKAGNKDNWKKVE